MDNHGRWLREQLEEWTEEGLVSPNAAEVLRERYDQGSFFSWTGPLFAASLICLVAGMALTGAGLWSSLSQDERFLLAVGPLVASDLLAMLFLAGDRALRRLRKRHDAEVRGLPDLLREGVGTFHGLAVTAAVWMVHDSFLLNENMSGLFAAAALSLLVMLYVLQSAGLGIIFGADAALAAWLNPVGGWLDGAAWLMLVAAFPFFFFLIGRRRQKAGIAFAWGWIASVLALTFVSASGPIWQVVFFAAVASLTWLIGAALRDYGWIGAALRFFGGAAVFAVLLLASFAAPWREVDGNWFLWFLLVVFLGADAMLLLRVAARREWLSITAGLTPFVMAAAVALTLRDGSGVSSAVLVSCYMVFLALAVIVRGVQMGRSWQVASGVMLLLGCGAVRLWDAALTFAQRGTFFFLAGVLAFLLCFIFRPPRRKHRRSVKTAEDEGVPVVLAPQPPPDMDETGPWDWGLRREFRRDDRPDEGEGEYPEPESEAPETDAAPEAYPEASPVETDSDEGGRTK